MNYDTYLLEQAESAKRHLERYAAAIVEVYADKLEIEQQKELFLFVLGPDLMKRVKFLPTRYH